MNTAQKVTEEIVQADAETLIDTVSEEVWNHDASQDNCNAIDKDVLTNTREPVSTKQTLPSRISEDEAVKIAKAFNEMASGTFSLPWLQPETILAAWQFFAAHANEILSTAAERTPVAWLAEERAMFDGQYLERLFSEEPPKGDSRYRKIRPLYADPLPITDLEARLAEALKVLEVTRSLVSEAAMTGFNCHEGDWAERLYANNGNISAVLDARRVREGGKVE